MCGYKGLAVVELTWRIRFLPYAHKCPLLIVFAASPEMVMFPLYCSVIRIPHPTPHCKQVDAAVLFTFIGLIHLYKTMADTSGFSTVIEKIFKWSKQKYGWRQSLCIFRYNVTNLNKKGYKNK